MRFLWKGPWGWDKWMEKKGTRLTHTLSSMMWVTVRGGDGRWWNLQTFSNVPAGPSGEERVGTCRVDGGCPSQPNQILSIPKDQALDSFSTMDFSTIFPACRTLYYLLTPKHITHTNYLALVMKCFLKFSLVLVYEALLNEYLFASLLHDMFNYLCLDFTNWS